MTNTITVDPDPVKAGKPIKVEHVKAGQIVRQWFDRCAAVPQYWRWVPAGLQVQ